MSRQIDGFVKNGGNGKSDESVVVGGWWDAADVVRHTSFRFCLDPAVEQQMVLSRHVGAARFAFDQCLRAVKLALAARNSDPTVSVSWSE